MEKLGFMPRQPHRDWKIPVSRDYALIIPCENVMCPVNKSDHCAMPSAIEISSGGKCKTGEKLITEKLTKGKNKNENKSCYKHEGD